MDIGHDVRMERDWSRLGRAVAKARKASGMTQDELAQAVGVGRSTIQGLERGAREHPKILLTHRAIATAIGWTPESIERVLAGGEPAMAEPDTPKEATAASGASASGTDPALDDLPLRVLRAIGAGRLVDSTVINLDPNDPDATATLVLKRGARPDASPEQMREDLRKWSELERAARRIYGDDQSSP